MRLAGDAATLGTCRSNKHGALITNLKPAAWAAVHPIRPFGA